MATDGAQHGLDNAEMGKDYQPPAGATTGDVERVEDDKSIGVQESESIDKSNIIEERTRGAAKAEGEYRDPEEDENLPTQDGTSSTA